MSSFVPLVTVCPFEKSVLLHYDAWNYVFISLWRLATESVLYFSVFSDSCFRINEIYYTERVWASRNKKDMSSELSAFKSNSWKELLFSVKLCLEF